MQAYKLLFLALLTVVLPTSMTFGFWRSPEEKQEAADRAYTKNKNANDAAQKYAHGKEKARDKKARAAEKATKRAEHQARKAQTKKQKNRMKHYQEDAE